MNNKKSISALKNICKQVSAIAVLLTGIIFIISNPMAIAAAPGDLDQRIHWPRVATIH